MPAPDLHPVSILRADGRVARQPDSYAYPPIALGGADPYDERSPMTLTCDSGAVHTVYHSRRSGYVNRWNQTQNATSCDMIRRVDGGQGNGVNEIWNERFGLANQFRHNPTMSAGVLRPTGSGQNNVPFSPLVYFNDYADGNQLVLDACTIPMEYEPDGFLSGAVADHGGNFDTPVIWTNARQFCRVTFNRNDVHSMETWGYFPRPWDGTDGPFVGLLVAGWFLQDYYSAANALQYYDLARRTSFAVPGWNVDSINVSANGLSRVIETSAGPTYSWPFTTTDGYGAYLLNGTTGGGQGVAIGIVAKVFGETGMRNVSNLTAVENRLPSHPAPGIDVSSGQILFVVNKTTSNRPAGWIGQRFLFTAVVGGTPISAASQLLARLDSIYARRMLDGPQQFIVPPQVTDDLAQFGPGYNAPA